MHLYRIGKYSLNVHYIFRINLILIFQLITYCKKVRKLLVLGNYMKIKRSIRSRVLFFSHINIFSCYTGQVKFYLSIRAT